MIDDNPDDLSPLILPLIELGIDLRIAEDAMLGCSMVITYRPDLILLDMNMPKIDGLSAILLIKGTPMIADIPIIFITANNDEESRIQGLRSGAVDYIIKPFHVQETLLRIKLHLKLAHQLKYSDTNQPNAPITPRLEASNYDQALVEGVTQYLRPLMSDPPTAKDIAERFGTYEKRLNQAFQQVFGCTLFIWIREERLRIAREMLLSGYITATRVSETLGYSSPAHFNRAFREHFGCTPRSLQRQHRDGDLAS